MMNPPKPLLDFARQMDQADPLAGFRDAFIIPSPDLLYMDGNSLGRAPKGSKPIVDAVLSQQWSDRLIRSWGEGWYTAPQRIGNKIGQLVGAAPGQVVITDSTSVNLYKLVMSALALRPGRTKIITDALNFPSDLYILQGCIQTLGGRHALTVLPARDSLAVDPHDLADAIDETTALVTLSHVVFKSGAMYDADEITRRAHAAGALVLFDLSHAAGAVPVELDAWGVDFAVGCTYKYLNGGPGAPAYLYVNQALQSQAISPIWGWFGQNNPFAFDLEYRPAPGIERFLCGTPPLLSLMAVEPGVDLLLEAGIARLREKSIRQTEYLVALFDRFLAPLGFILGSPRDPSRRGSHISIRHAEGYRINRALIDEMAVIPDFREPDNIRLGIASIYTKYEEIWETVQRIRQVVEEKRFEKYPVERAAVT